MKRNTVRPSRASVRPPVITDISQVIKGGVGGPPGVVHTFKDTVLPNASEASEQQTVIAWCEVWCQRYEMLQMLFHPANGEFRHPATGMRLRRMGVRPGVPDLLLPAHSVVPPFDKYYGLAVEMKVRANTQSPAQRKYLQQLANANWYVAVCYSAAVAIEVIAGYVGMPRNTHPQ